MISRDVSWQFVNSQMDLDSNTLIASLVWGSIGAGFVVYGKKQSEPVTLFGGLALVGVSYFAGTALMMSLISVTLIAAIFWLRRQFPD